MAEKNKNIWKSEFGWAQILSIVSITISIVMPTVGYLYFSPKLEAQKTELAELKEELKNRPELIVSKVKEPAEGDRNLNFEVINVGKFPAKDLQIIIVTTASDKILKASDKKEAIRDHLLVTPDIQYEPEFEGGMWPIIRLTLKRPLVPNEKMAVTVLEGPISVSLQNQYGDMIHIYS